MKRQGFVVIDTETTGGGPDARVIEIGVVFLSERGSREAHFTTLLRGEGSGGHWAARKKHRIRDEDLAPAPSFGELAPAFLRAIQGRIMFAHNSSFDEAQINQELRRVRRRRIGNFGCTLGLGIHLGYGRMSLDKAVKRFGLSRDASHVALADADAAANLLKHYMKHNPAEFREYLLVQRLYG